MSYNGWKNWETWNVALWCDNGEGIYRQRMEDKPRTAEQVEEFIRFYFPDGTPDWKNDDPYDRGAYCVDWQEIADHWVADYEEEAA